MADYGLRDIFRLYRKPERMYTHFNKQHKTRSRLDFFIVDDNLVNFPICGASISHGFKSDHSYITLNIQGSTISHGRGYWKLNNSHLLNETFVSNVRNIIQETVTNSYDSYSGLWDVTKMKIKDYAIRYGKNVKKERNEEKKKLQNEIENIKKLPDFMDKDIMRKKYFDSEAKLNSIIQQEVKGTIIRSRIQ